MGVKKIDFKKRGDYDNIDDYYRACKDNVIMELYCRSMFAGNTISLPDCIYYMDDCGVCQLCTYECNCPYD